jgi:hypothetical protein
MPKRICFYLLDEQRLGILSLDDINDTQIDIEMPDDLKF